MPEPLEQLKTAHDRKEDIYVIHYACEGFYDVGQHLPRIVSIVVRSLDGEKLHVFSRTSSVGDPISDDAELQLLKEYFEFIRASTGAKFVHWNMSKPYFGFQAIESRFGQLTGTTTVSNVASSNCFDLDSIIEVAYGAGFANHPKLRSLAELNGLVARYALSGTDEVKYFAAADIAAIDRSLDEKVEWIRRLSILSIEGRLTVLGSFERTLFAGIEIDASTIVKSIARRFLYVSRELGHRHNNRPSIEFNDEYDDQDLMRALLRIFFDDVRKEEWTPSYAGGSSRIDFVLPECGLAVELKHARASMTSAGLGAELIVDIDRYKENQHVEHLLCMVFDHDGYIDNPRGIEGDLTTNRGSNDFPVTVIVIDR